MADGDHLDQEVVFFCNPRLVDKFFAYIWSRDEFTKRARGTTKAVARALMYDTAAINELKSHDRASKARMKLEARRTGITH